MVRFIFIKSLKGTVASSFYNPSQAWTTKNPTAPLRVNSLWVHVTEHKVSPATSLLLKGLSAPILLVFLIVSVYSHSVLHCWYAMAKTCPWLIARASVSGEVENISSFCLTLKLDVHECLLLVFICFIQEDVLCVNRQRHTWINTKLLFFKAALCITNSILRREFIRTSNPSL